MKTENLGKLTVVLLLVLAAVISATFLADRFSSPETYEKLSESIDKKITTVGTLTGAATVASVAVSAIPDDTATPIADRLAELTEYFLAVLCVLYAEKYLLTLIGGLTFRIIIPIVCLIIILYVIFRRGGFVKAGIKLALFAVVISIAVPLSIIASDAIYDTYMPSIDAAISSAQSLSDDANSINSEDDETGNIISQMINGVSQKIHTIVEKASALLSSFLKAIAIMLVTSCIIPILTLIFCLWLIKLVTGYDVEDRSGGRRFRFRRGGYHQNRQKEKEI